MSTYDFGSRHVQRDNGHTTPDSPVEILGEDYHPSVEPKCREMTNDHSDHPVGSRFSMYSLKKLITNSSPHTYTYLLSF